MTAKRLLIVDDSVTIRAMIEALFEKRGTDIKIIGVFGDGQEALDAIARQRPDVVTLDINMPGLNGIAVLNKIMEGPPIAVVIVSTEATEGSDLCREALELGASVCFDKARIMREADIFVRSVMKARPRKFPRRLRG